MKKIFALTTLLIAFFAIPALAETQSLFIEGDHGKLAAVLQIPDSNSKCQSSLFVMVLWVKKILLCWRT